MSLLEIIQKIKEEKPEIGKKLEDNYWETEAKIQAEKSKYFEEQRQKFNWIKRNQLQTDPKDFNKRIFEFYG